MVCCVPSVHDGAPTDGLLVPKASHVRFSDQQDLSTHAEFRTGSLCSFSCLDFLKLASVFWRCGFRHDPAAILVNQPQCTAIVDIAEPCDAIRDPHYDLYDVQCLLRRQLDCELQG